MRKLLALVLVAVLVVSLFTGCGEISNKNESTNSTTESDAEYDITTDKMDEEQEVVEDVVTTDTEYDDVNSDEDSLLSSTGKTVVEAFQVLSASDEVAVIRFRDDNNVLVNGLMNTDGEIYFQFAQGIDAYHAVDNYIYGDYGIFDLDGNLLYQFPDDSYSIMTYGDGIFLVQQDNSNITQSNVKYGFIYANGEWIIQPSISAKDFTSSSLSSISGNGYGYLGNGYFYNRGDDGTVLFINPETGNRLEVEDITYIKGLCDDVVVVTRGNTSLSPVSGVDLENGTIVDYSLYASDVSYATEKYILTRRYSSSTYSNVCVYDTNGRKILNLSEYTFLDSPCILNNCVFGQIRGADGERYIVAIEIESGEYLFEPVAGYLGIRNDSYALINSDNKYILNLTNGSLTETEYYYSSDDSQIDNYDSLFVVKDSNIFVWDSGSVKRITPYIIED